MLWVLRFCQFSKTTFDLFKSICWISFLLFLKESVFSLFIDLKNPKKSMICHIIRFFNNMARNAWKKNVFKSKSSHWTEFITLNGFWNFMLFLSHLLNDWKGFLSNKILCEVKENSFYAFMPCWNILFAFQFHCLRSSVKVHAWVDQKIPFMWTDGIH